jgi:hypothetical protein
VTISTAVKAGEANVTFPPAWSGTVVPLSNCVEMWEVGFGQALVTVSTSRSPRQCSAS